MKKIFLTLLTLLTTATLWAQAPQRMSYQSVIRDGNNVVVASTTVGIKISLLQGTAAGSAVYVETHRKATNANGLLSLEIGDGTAISGTFAGIDWANGPYLIKTETDPTGGTNYSILGIAALNSVPYALFSANGNGTPGPQGATGPQGAIGPAGSDGTNGANGSPGPSGAIGDKGDKGDTGAAGSQGPAGPMGQTGDAGTNGLDGKTVLNGTSNPATGQGMIGDFYINTITSMLFGPKVSGGWPTGVSLVGAAGTQGIQGVTGANGTDGTNGTNGAVGAAGVGGVTTAGTNITLSGSGTIASPYVVSTNIPTVLPILSGGTGQITKQGILNTLGFKSDNVAIGNEAGLTNQSNYTIAIGGGSGRTNQGMGAIGIGYVSGDSNQGLSSIAIGPNAAQANQKNQAVAIGYAAGQNNQGQDAVAIGTFSGQSNQAANSIAINASGTTSPLNPANAGFYVDPIRLSSGSLSLFYDATTKEITYGTASPSGSVVAVANGGTGTTTLTGYVKGNGTSTMTAIAAIPIADVTGAAPLASPTLTGTPLAPTASLGTNTTQLATTAFVTGAVVTSLDGLSDSKVGGTNFINSMIIGHQTTGVLSGASDNTALGSNSLASISSGQGNTSVGRSALASNTSGNGNTALGSNSLSSVTTGTLNTAVGEYSLNQSTGSSNTAVGRSASYFNTTASFNTAVGVSALGNTSTGGNNTGLGFQALQSNTSGTGNTGLGHGANVFSSGLTNATAIGNGAIVNASNKIQLGNTAITNVTTSGTLTAGAVTYPNTHNTTAGQVLTTDGSGIASWATPVSSSSPTYTIGLNNDLGGYVIFVTPDGKHGLVAAMQDQSTSINWYDAQEKISDPVNHDANGKKYTDWRMPTTYELTLIHSSKEGIGGSLADDAYWFSSIEDGQTNARNLGFKTKNIGSTPKTNTLRVRSVRAF